MNEVTRILSSVDQGDANAAEQLLPLVYEELRRLAVQRMAQEAPGQTLQPTGLVHEAYLRLVATEQAQARNSRGHFFASAAEAMRRILIERARRQATQWYGGSRRRLNLDQLELAQEGRSRHLLALYEVLTVQEEHDSRAAQLVKPRCSRGMTHQEAAAALGLGGGRPTGCGPTPAPGCTRRSSAIPRKTIREKMNFRGVVA